MTKKNPKAPDRTHLRALATLMESQVPSVILPEPEPEFAEVEGG